MNSFRIINSTSYRAIVQLERQNSLPVLKNIPCHLKFETIRLIYDSFLLCRFRFFFSMEA